MPLEPIPHTEQAHSDLGSSEGPPERWELLSRARRVAPLEELHVGGAAALAPALAPVGLLTRGAVPRVGGCRATSRW